MATLKLYVHQRAVINLTAGEIKALTAKFGSVDLGIKTFLDEGFLKIGFYGYEKEELQPSDIILLFFEPGTKADGTPMILREVKEYLLNKKQPYRKITTTSMHLAGFTLIKNLLPNRSAGYYVKVKNI